MSAAGVMPTALAYRLTWRQMVAFRVLLGRIRLLNCRMERFNRRHADNASPRVHRRLVRGALAWLALNDRMVGLLGGRETERVAEARTVFSELLPD